MESREDLAELLLILRDELCEALARLDNRQTSGCWRGEAERVASLAVKFMDLDKRLSDLRAKA